MTYPYLLDRVPDMATRINGPALRAIRERSGLTQSELSRVSGVSQGRISSMESGSPNVRPGMVQTLAEALRVPTVALLADPPAEVAS